MATRSASFTVSRGSPRAMEQTERIGIIGGGRAGSALAKGLGRVGWSAHVAPRDVEGQRRVARECTVLFLAIPFPARQEVARDLGDLLDGKIVIDVTNPMKFPGPEYVHVGAGSGAEELARWLPRAHVVKAFNTVFSPSLESASVGGQQVSMFAAADDEDARRRVLAIGRAMGFDAVDAGPLSNARWLEGLLFLEMMLEKVHGSQIGWRFLRPTSR